MKKYGKILGVGLTLIMVLSCVVYAENSREEAFNPIESYSKIDNTKSGIETYKSNVVKRIDDISSKKIKDINCTITFSEKISLDELKSFVEKYAIDLEFVEVRYVKDGERSTAGIRFLDDYNQLKYLIESTESEHDVQLQGIVDIYARVDADMLEDVQNDEIVFLTDISGDAVMVGNYSVNQEERNKNYAPDGLDSFPCALSWDLEDAGIVDMYDK